MRPTPDEPERRCILSGEHGGRDSLIRLALGPDGAVAADLGAKAGGRGAWLAVARPALETAIAKGKLRGALARAFKGAALTIPEDLAERIAAGLESRAMDRLGLENRAGNIILGSERIEGAIAAGQVGLLLSAEDAGNDGLTSMRAKLRHAGDGVALSAPAPREALSRAVGRANTVHAAVRSGSAAERVMADFGRWRAFLGLDLPRAADRPGAPRSHLAIAAGSDE